MRIWGCILLLVSFYVSGQQAGRIETDRPDQTECPFIVRKGYFQGEIGFNRNVSKEEVVYFSPTSLWKIGLANWAELRLTTVLQSQDKLAHFQLESAGAKFHLFSGTQLIPRSAVIVQYHVNNQNRDASERNSSPHSVGEVVFTMQNTIHGSWGVGYNFGTEFHSNGGLEGIVRIAPNVSIGKKGYAYVEFFGRLPKSTLSDTWLDGGLAYYLTDEVKFDISVGKSLQASQLWYAALGLSFRFKMF